MTQGKTPENSRPDKGARSGDHEVQHEPYGIIERLDQQPRGDVGHDDHGDYPAENETKQARENHVGEARVGEKIEVAVNEPLGAHDPEANGGKSEHDRIMNRHAEAER